MATLARDLYTEVYLDRQGPVSITPLVTPNAILIVGRAENVKSVKDLVARLDQPAIPGSLFHVFHLKYTDAASAQTTIRAPSRIGGLSAVVRVTADTRTNSLIVQAGSRDMAEVANLIQTIDISGKGGPPINDVRIIRLQHTSAKTIVNIINAAILNVAAPARARAFWAAAGPFPAVAARPFPGGGGTFRAAEPCRAARPQNRQRASAPLPHGRCQGPQAAELGNPRPRVRIHCRSAANAVVISSPPENLDLLEAIVQHLDDRPRPRPRSKSSPLSTAMPRALQHAPDRFSGRQHHTTGGTASAAAVSPACTAGNLSR